VRWCGFVGCQEGYPAHKKPVPLSQWFSLEQMAEEDQGGLDNLGTCNLGTCDLGACDRWQLKFRQVMFRPVNF